MNTRANPPTTTWIHPSGPVSAPPPPPEPTYSAPAAPPPNSTYPGGYNAGSQGGYPGQGAGNGYPQQQQPYYGDRREYEQNSQNYPQQSEQKGLGMILPFIGAIGLTSLCSIGGLLGRFTGGGRHGGGGGFGGGGGGGFGRGGGGRFDDEGRFGGGGYPPYQGPQPQVVYAEQQQPPKKSGGIGMGGLALGSSYKLLDQWHNFTQRFFLLVGGGLLGGMLIEDMIDNVKSDECNSRHYPTLVPSHSYSLQMIRGSTLAPISAMMIGRYISLIESFFFPLRLEVVYTRMLYYVYINDL